MEWTELQRSARQLESRLEARLMQFSKLNSLLGRRASSFASPGGGGRSGDDGGRLGEDAAEHEHAISKLFDDLQEVIDNLGRCMAHGTTRRTANSALLQRFREVYRDDRSEFERVRSAVRAKLQRSELFGSLGLPLRVSPNFETQECQWSFGEAAPPPADDPTWPKGCIVGCGSRELMKEPIQPADRGKSLVRSTGS